MRYSLSYYEFISMKNKKILEMNEQFCIKRLFYVPVEILFCSVLFCPEIVAFLGRQLASFIKVQHCKLDFFHYNLTQVVIIGITNIVTFTVRNTNV